MATIREVVESKLLRYNIELSEVELDGYIIDQGMNPGDEYTSDATLSTKLLYFALLPELLLAPDITEGGFARKWDRAAIKTFISLLAKELGKDDPFAVDTPTMTYIGDRW